nr:MAG TPA: carboxylesterase family protein [Caudoviricetes sp.]
MSDLFFALLAAQAGGDGTPVAPAPSPAAPFRVGSDVNIVVDANSYYALWTYPAIDTVGAFGQLVRERGASSRNVAIPGQTWENMRVNISDMVRAFDPAKKNVLVCGETRNWVASTAGATAEQAVEQAKEYIAAAQEAVKVKHGKGFDRIVLCGTIPNSTLGDEPWKGDIPGLNRVLIRFDDYARAHYREMGADAFADFRTNTQWFGGDGTTKPGFAQTQATVQEQLATGEWVHPTGVAREAFAEVIADALKRLEA